MAKKPTDAARSTASVEAPADADASFVADNEATAAIGAGETAAAAIEQTVAALKDSVAGVVAGYEKTQTEVKANMDKAVKSAEEMVSFSQGNFEAMMKSGQVWAAGFQDLQKAMAASAQAQVEAAMGTFKAISGVKSLKEAMDLQSSLARNSFETAMNETGKLTDASMKLAEQAMAPITARVTLAVEKFGRVG